MHTVTLEAIESLRATVYAHRNDPPQPWPLTDQEYEVAQFLKLDMRQFVRIGKPQDLLKGWKVPDVYPETCSRAAWLAAR